MKTSKNDSIQLPEDQIQTLRALLQKYLPNHSVYAFGSRANGTSRATSDLDLLIQGDCPAELSVLAELRADLEEAEIDPRVDLVDWWAIDEEFRKEIWPQARPFYLRAA